MTSSRRQWVWMSAVAVAAIWIAALGLGLRFARQTRLRAAGIGAAGRPAVAVMPFEDAGRARELAWLSRGLQTLLLDALGQTPGLDIVPARRLAYAARQAGHAGIDALEPRHRGDVARRAGAGAAVHGRFRGEGQQIQIDAELQDLASGRTLATASVRGSNLFSLVDELAGRIRTGVRAGDASSIRPVSEITTSSLDAFRMYLEATDPAGNRRPAEIRERLDKAVAIDPSFALAYLLLANVTEASRQPERAEDYRRQVIARLDRLPPRQRLLVETASAARNRDLAQAVAALERLAARYPDEEEAYGLLSALYTGANQPDKALRALGRGVAALPASGSLRNSYGYQLLRSGRYGEALAAFEAYTTISPREANAFDSLAEAYMILGRPEPAIQQYSRALTLDPSFLVSYEGRAWASAMSGRYDEALADLERAEKLAAQSPALAGRQHFMTAFLLSRVGRYREAEEEIAQGVRLAESRRADASLGMQGALTLLASLTALERADYARAANTAARARTLFERIPALGIQREWGVLARSLEGIAEARAGRVDRARAHLDAQKAMLDARRVEQRWWRQALEGEIALAAGDPAAAEAAFAAGEPQGKMWFDRSPTAVSLNVFANSLSFRDGSARARQARDDLAGATDAYRGLLAPDPRDKWTAALEPRFVLALARLQDKRGDADAARQQYQRFLDLWNKADPGLPEVDEALRRLGSR